MDTPPGALTRRLSDLWQRHADLVLVIGLTLLAAIPRLWQLDAIPQGVHGDEAQYGVDAQRVLRDGWIGVYTQSALGQPAGIAYVIAPGQWLFGPTALGARFSIALFAIAAVPLAYVLFRLLSTRAIAAITAFLLAVSLWHIHFSRVAYQPALVPTMELLVLVFWALGMQRGRWYWFAASGAALGLGMYTYNVYPIFVIAFSVWVLVYTIVFKRRALMPWAQNVAIVAAAAAIFALPLLAFMSDPKNDYFNHYRGYYEQYSVLQSKPYKEADVGGKVDIVTTQARLFVGAYVSKGVSDYVDGASPDNRSMFDIVTVALIPVGVGVAVWRWRETPHLMALLLVLIILLTTVLQTNSTYRGPLGAAPFLLFLAALPLGVAVSKAGELRKLYRPLLYGGVAVILAVVAYANLAAYRDWTRAGLFPWVYAQEISAASSYAEAQAGEPYVYFYSARWSFNYETRQYLAPNVKGEDRSKEFGRTQGLEADRGRDSLFLLLPPYTSLLPDLERLYPEGKTHQERDGDATLFIAFRVPAATAPRVEAPVPSPAPALDSAASPAR